MTGTEKRPRGRPKNTGINRMADAQRLAAIADVRLHDEHKPLADIVRPMLPGNDTGGIHRLRRRFREERETLMLAARLRHDKLMLAAKRRHDEEVAQQIARNFRNLVHTADAVGSLMTSKLNGFLGSPEGQALLDKLTFFDRFAQSPEARKWAELAAKADRWVELAAGPSKMLGGRG